MSAAPPPPLGPAPHKLLSWRKKALFAALVASFPYAILESAFSIHHARLPPDSFQVFEDRRPASRACLTTEARGC